MQSFCDNQRMAHVLSLISVLSQTSSDKNLLRRCNTNRFLKIPIMTQLRVYADFYMCQKTIYTVGKTNKPREVSYKLNTISFPYLNIKLGAIFIDG